MDRTRTRSVGDNGLRFLLVLSLAVVGMVGVVSLPALAMEGAASTDERPADERPTDDASVGFGIGGAVLALAVVGYLASRVTRV